MVTAGSCPRWFTARGPTVVRGFGDRVERNQLPGGGSHVQQVERGGVRLILRQELQDHLIIVGRGVNVGYLARAVGVIQRVFDLVRRHSQGRGVIAVDLYLHQRAGDQQIAVDVDQSRNIPQALFEIVRGAVELLQVLRLQRVLIQAPALLAADAHQRRILEVRFYARDLVQQGPELIHDLFRRGFPLGAGFQANLQIAGVAGVVSASAGPGKVRVHVRILGDDGVHLLLQPPHDVEGCILGEFGGSINLIGVLAGDEALGNQSVQIHGDAPGWPPPSSAWQSGAGSRR